jgi:hypothetical protein
MNRRPNCGFLDAQHGQWCGVSPGLLADNASRRFSKPTSTCFIILAEFLILRAVRTPGIYLGLTLFVPQVSPFAEPLLSYGTISHSRGAL